MPDIISAEVADKLLSAKASSVNCAADEVTFTFSSGLQLRVEIDPSEYVIALRYTLLP